MANKNKRPLSTWIFAALILGIVAGILLTGSPDFATSYIKPWGDLFLNLIKLIVVPVVLFSILAGVVSLEDIKKVGSIGWKVVVYYLATTVAALILGLVVANLAKGLFVPLETADLSYQAAEAPSLITTIVNIFPANIIAPMASANMLQVIVIALFVGFGVILAGEKGAPAAKLIDSLNEVFIQVMMFIIKLSPIGVFCLISPVVATNGPSVLGSLAAVLGVAYLCYILQMAIVYTTTVKALGGINPGRFFKGVAPAMVLAFSSASSVGTLPLNMRCCEALGGRKDIISFSLPLGATINMDGTAIYQAVCSVFIASCFGIQLSLMQMLTIVLTATLASIGTAGVPGAGMIMLAMVLESVGLPVEGIALVAGIDRIFDMGRTTVNITGDAACALVVSKLESKKGAMRQIS
jgi:Na+/H+-dicarboxylate symporter